jgi:hypothetical protein
MNETVVREIAQVRAEYASARLIHENLDRRAAGARRRDYPGYLPAEIDYRTASGETLTARIRDYDVRFLDRVASAEAVGHMDLIHRARRGEAPARAELSRRTARLGARIGERFAGGSVVEDEWVVPYTSTGRLTEVEISNKGATLLDLSRRGIATSDFSILTSRVCLLPPAARERCARDALADLERLSGRRLGDPDHPLLIAVRTAMPEYVPGFMPTWLNVGFTPALMSGLPDRYGEEAAARIRLNNRKTILEALRPEAFAALEGEIRPHLTREENHRLASTIEAFIRREDAALLDNPLRQVLFFLRKAYEYYETHLDTLRNFMGRDVHQPSVILQRMVCSVLDGQCLAGVLYSRHPRTGLGVHLQYAREIYGEDLMTGRLRPEEETFLDREQARREFPSVYHFWPRLAQLEEILEAPVMVEFTGVHGTFTLLQLNVAELSGVGMLAAVMDLFRSGKIGAGRVRALIRPYHVRQIETDAVDPESLCRLTRFCRGFSVLPRSAVTGRVFFTGAAAREAKERNAGEQVILARARFTPQDAIDMQGVGGILSLSPAAIHVVTTAQNLGVPALLDLEEDGVRLDEEEGVMRNARGVALREGDPVTISSEDGGLFLGRAVFAPARLLRLMAGEAVDLSPAEEAEFRLWAGCYRDYRQVVEGVGASEFTSLKDLGHAVRYGRLQGDVARATEFVNRCFVANAEALAAGLFDTTLGNHLVNRVAFDLLAVDRQARLVRAALKTCRERGLSGYGAGAFVLGSFVSSSSPVAFWTALDPAETGLLVNEWVLHRKYLAVLAEVGERRVSRARDQVLSKGLGSLAVRPALLLELMPLKLAGTGLAAARAALPAWSDPQTVEVLTVLGEPWSMFFDYGVPCRLAALRALCESAGRPVPPPDAR